MTMRLCLSLLLCLASLVAGEAPPVAQPGPRAYLGVAIDTAASTLDGKGLVVLRVEPGSPAAVMGLAAGDRIVAIDGAALKTPEDLAAAIAGRKPGDSVALEVHRNRGVGGLPEALKPTGVLQETPRTKIASLGNQLNDLGERLSELSRRAKDPTLAELLARLQEIERDLPKAAEAFKKVYPDGEFRIVISVEITSDKTAKQPLGVEVGGQPPVRP